MSDNNTVYKIISRHHSKTSQDVLFCLYCNKTCTRGNFANHKKTTKHKQSSPEPFPWQKGYVDQKMPPSGEATKKKKYVRFAQPEVEVIKEEKMEEPESSDDEDVTYEDCSDKTISLMKIKLNHLNAKTAKLQSPDDRYDASVISKIMIKQPVPYDEFKKMYNRLTELKM